jgi:ADP-ribose pyrophosphatase YjhB (NUDIX family)
VAPGGGVQGHESLEDAARREAREETGLVVEAHRIAYIEELINPDARTCKFWFAAQVVGGALSADAPEARCEHIVDAAWLSRSQIEGKTVFPPVLADRYWDDRASAFAAPVRLGLRRMEFW